MACVTCSHTLDSIRDGIFHCPRCGTMQDGGNVYIPKLVERCRTLEPVVLDSTIEFAWTQSGVAESINLPEARPAT